MPPFPRKRGGQPGNTNALKHGYYSPRFHKLEAADLAALVEEGPASEIALLRVLIRRMVEHMENEDLPTKDLIATFNAVTSASVSIGTLLRTQEVLGSSQADEIAAALQAALAEVTRELGL
jgi:hypothetical protein